jgi:UPF0716 family protein affecting phage T7 exclusion
VVEEGMMIVVAGIVVTLPGRVTVTAGRVVVKPGNVTVFAGTIKVVVLPQALKAIITTRRDNKNAIDFLAFI